jgi:biotin carboxyl carrier protein
VDSAELSPHLFSILHQDQSYEVRFHSNPKKETLDVEFHDETYPVVVTDPMSLLLESTGGAARKGGATLEAAMPGKVQRILVKEGDQVTEDQGLLVLVAMKMENELGSPTTGTVKQILVSEGANVEGGAPLIILQ